jgi:CRISPR type III-B/RAMP module-associated protein Cmr5
MSLENKSLKRAAFAHNVVKGMLDDLQVKEEALDSEQNVNRKKELKNACDAAKKRKDYYATQGSKLSTMIQTNGLVATAAFLKVKGYTGLYDDLKNWLKEQGHFGLHDQDDLVHKMVSSTSTEVLMATHEAIAISDWLKRMVEALIENKKL